MSTTVVIVTMPILAFSVFAEFEREIIAERIHAGLARTKEQGTKSGKPIGRPEVFGTVREKAVALKERVSGRDA